MGSFWVTASALGLGAPEFDVCPLRAESLFPTVLWLSHTGAALGFKARCSGSLSSLYIGLGSPVWGLDPLLLREGLCNCDYPPICGLPTFWLYSDSIPAPAHLVVVPSLNVYLWEIFSASLLFIP